MVPALDQFVVMGMANFEIVNHVNESRTNPATDSSGAAKRPIREGWNESRIQFIDGSRGADVCI